MTPYEMDLKQPLRRPEIVPNVGDYVKIKSKEWYDYCQEVTEFHFESMNFQSWLRGAPRVSQQVLDRLRALKAELNDCIQEEKERINGK